MIVLANDGISQVGVEKLENNGFKVITTNVAQDQIIDYINRNSITCLLVRSATKVRKDIIDSCESLKLIGRGGELFENMNEAFEFVEKYQSYFSREDIMKIFVFGEDKIFFSSKKVEEIKTEDFEEEEIEAEEEEIESLEEEVKLELKNRSTLFEISLIQCDSCSSCLMTLICSSIRPKLGQKRVV